MSKYGDVFCPYCDNYFYLNHDDGAYYDESNNEEAFCPSCEKPFMVSSSMTWLHEGVPIEPSTDQVSDKEENA
jgi:uncharacterized Zn finger protein (UPF0148 family)